MLASGVGFSWAKACVVQNPDQQYKHIKTQQTTSQRFHIWINQTCVAKMLLQFWYCSLSNICYQCVNTLQFDGGAWFVFLSFLFQNLTVVLQPMRSRLQWLSPCSGQLSWGWGAPASPVKRHSGCYGSCSRSTSCRLSAQPRYYSKAGTSHASYFVKYFDSCMLQLHCRSCCCMKPYILSPPHSNSICKDAHIAKCWQYKPIG